MSQPRIRILLIDDHFVVRMGLVAALSTESDFDIVGEAGTAAQAAAIVLEKDIDVAVLDWRMPESHGAETIKTLRSAPHPPRVLVYSAHAAEEDVFLAINAGAHSYLEKTVSRSEIVAAIRDVYKGRQHLPKNIADKLVARIGRSELSPRETQVLGYIAKGMSNKEIAEALGITPGTAKLHVLHIFTKLEVHDRSQAIANALSRGLIQM